MLSGECVHYCGEVTCYHCGHVSGQLMWHIYASHEILNIEDFRPRRGYTKPIPRRGESLRCERCGGPVYVDDLRPAKGIPRELAPAIKGRGRGPRRIA